MASTPDSLDRGSDKRLLRNKTAIAVNRWYDERMFAPWAARRFAGSDFHNYGYWEPHTRNQKEACENLMHALLAFIPRKQGTILDVACGKGATTRYLLRYYAAESVTGINISEKQLGRCRLNAPMCNFLLMDATDLAFNDNSFDNIICVEAAMHFVTREKFFEAAYRILKPSGRLVLSDILPSRELPATNALCPEDLALNGFEYQQRFIQAGFENVQIKDATTECSAGSMKHSLALLHNQLRLGEIDHAGFELQKDKVLARHRQVGAYFLVCATKTARR